MSAEPLSFHVIQAHDHGALGQNVQEHVSRHFSIIEIRSSRVTMKRRQGRLGDGQKKALRTFEPLVAWVDDLHITDISLIPTGRIHVGSDREYADIYIACCLFLISTIGVLMERSFTYTDTEDMLRPA